MALNADRLRLLLLLGILAAALGVGLYSPRLPQGFDLRLHDLGWRLFAASAAPQREERLILIDIDERSLAELGPWPWPRARLAELAERLKAAGAAMQVWDVVFDRAEPDDAVFAAALQASPTVLAAAFALPGQGEAIATGSLAAAPAGCVPPMAQAIGHRAPAAAFARTAVGHITPRVDADGRVRAQPAYVCRDGRRVPALGLAAWLVLNRAPEILPSPGRGALAAPWQLAAQELPSALPLGASGELIIPYRLPRGAFQAVSAADLLHGRVAPEALAGRIALIGSTAFGLADVVATPLAPAEGGLLVHAQLLAALLDGALPHPPRQAAPLQGLALLVALGLLYLAARRRPAAYVLPLAGLGLALLLLLLQLVLQAQGLLLGLSLPAAATLLAGLVLGSHEALRAGVEGARLFAHLRTYLPAPFAERLASLAPAQAPATELVEASVLVADLRNFTPYAAAHPPAEVGALLQRYFSTAVAIIENGGGYVQALEGDAVIAIWNGLAPCPRHAERALAAAQALARAIPPLLPSAPPEGLPPPLALEIGLDSGPVLFGAFGPASRRQHLALGLPVTRALRLAHLAGEFGADVLIGPGLAAQLPPEQRATLQERGSFLLEGLTQACDIFSVAAPQSA